MKYQLRAEFPGYYPPTDGELAELWEIGHIVLDTNALLNLFRYSEATREELLNLLERESDRIWLPHQVALELHRNRRAIPVGQEASFNSVRDAINGANATIDATISVLRRHASREAEALTQELKRSTKRLKRTLRKTRRTHRDAVIGQDAHDKAFNRVGQLYAARVGDPFSAEELLTVEKEGTKRFAAKIPPGYRDSSKTENKFGDLIIWKQMLQKGISTKKPMIFITDDAKEDWWERVHGKTIGARPELVEEYLAASEGKRIHFYSTMRFLEYARSHGAKISDEALEETNAVSKSQSTLSGTARSLQLSPRQRERILKSLGASTASLGGLDIENSFTQRFMRETFPKLDPSPSDLARQLGLYSLIIEGNSSWLGTLSAFDNELWERIKSGSYPNADFSAADEHGPLETREEDDDENETATG